MLNYTGNINRNAYTAYATVPRELNALVISRSHRSRGP